MGLVKVHMLLATFMFPAALMFLITGALYTWSVKGSYATEQIELTLVAPLEADQDMLVDIVTNELDARSIAYPTGQPKVKKGGTSYKLEWTGSQRDVVLEPTDDPLVASLSVKETTWYRNLVQLHKAKGGSVFKVYAAALAIALFVILFSGFILSFQVPALKKQAVIATIAGAVFFVAMVLVS